MDTHYFDLMDLLTTNIIVIPTTWLYSTKFAHYVSTMPYFQTAYHFGYLGISTSAVVYLSIVVERSPIRSFAANYRLLQHLGFNHMSSRQLFLLS